MIPGKNSKTSCTMKIITIMDDKNDDDEDDDDYGW